MSGSPERLEKLSAKQRAAYELLLRRRQDEAAARSRVAPVGRETNSFPLSFAQQRLWFLSELRPDSPVYHVPASVRLRGPLDADALRRCLREVVRRHESLRTSFRVTDGQPEQVIEDEAAVELPLLDLSALPEARREEEARRVVAEEYARPFSLRRGGLWRASLLRLGPAEHVLSLTMHHIVSDDWSVTVLAGELGALYEAFTRGEASPLGELPVQYADYAHWQRQWLRGEELERQFDYWSRQLAGGPAPLQLPADRPRPPVQSFRGGACPVHVPRELADALRRVCQEEGCTLFMGLLAAFQAVLHRYTNQDEVVVGSPIANRGRAELEGLIGFFVNMLVLRTDLSGDPTFRELLGRVREVCLGAYAHQDLPFEQMVERFQPGRDLGRTPLFQVALVLQNAPKPLRDGGAGPVEGGLSWSPYGVARGTSKFDLTLNLQETPGGLEGVLEYNSDIFDEASVGRLARHLAALLEAAAREPGQRVWSLPLLTPEERRRLTGPERAKPRRADECLHRLFEARAAARPDSFAVSFEGERLTYAELNRRANRLAHTLRARGVGPESLVGVCLEPSAETVAAILGVLKAGGAYLPLDPSYPQERLAYMLEDAGVSLVVTRPAQAGVLPADGVETLCLEADAATIERAGDENPAGGAEPDNLCYVIYTSGSTGRPKGVEVTHRNVSRLLSATERWFDFGAEDVWTLFHSYAFDFSVWEIWGALCYGGRLVVVPFWVTRTPEAMRGLIEAEGVTVLNQTPSAFKQLMAADEAEGRTETSLRYVIFGGEALEPKSLRGWVERHGDERPRLVNMYGITETTVHVTYRRVREADVAAGDGSPVGVPIEDLKVYLLDRARNLTPAGVVGEMYVAGGGLARGYRGRGELTAGRFIPDAFGGEPGARLYRSGDLARYRADGGLEYLGRADQQVKVRGFRIELGEIESALASQPEVKEAAVLARAEADGDSRLTAFVVMREGGDVRALRGRLAGWLPGHMLPASFVGVESMPLTPNGKLDRRALEAIEVERPASGESYAPPRTPVEEVLAGVWSEVLGVERVGIDDNYFALGGDSIRSIHLRSLARGRGVEVTLQQVFQHQTIRDLAGVARLGLGAAEETPRTPAFGLLSDEDRLRLPAGLEDAYPLALLQAGMIFHGEYDDAADVYHNVGSFRLRAPFDSAALAEAVRRLLARHAVLRTSFDLHTYDEPLQLVHAEVAAPLAVEDLRGLDAAEQETRLERFQAEERARHFVWDRPPLLRFAAHRLADDTFQFTLTEHHAILDGWSVASLLTELFKSYFSLLGAEAPPEEPPPAVDYRDFVALERAALNSAESRDFWLSRLSDSVPVVLPRPGGDAAPRAKLVRVFEVPIAPETSEGLRRLALRNAVPVKSLLLAAHLRVLALVGGQPDVISGVVANGRPEEDGGERVLGLFLNTIPFRLKLRGGTWAELARQTYEAELELLPHRRYPLAEMQRARGGRPLFEVAFNYTHFHVYDGLREFDGVELLGTDGVAATNFTLGANFGVSLNNSQVRLALHCDVGAIGAEAAERMAGYYARALEAMARDPEGRYETADLLSGEEAGLLLRGVNDTRRERPSDPTLHGLFEAQARRAPGASAVAFGDESITYGELDARADELALRLRALGLGPESCVGVSAEPCVEMIVGLLGVLKAGAAYVPLEPRYPRERIAFILEDARVSVVLARAALAERFAAHGVRVVTLDTPDGAAEDEVARERAAAEPAAGEARAEVSADNVAYVIHTSGSTGTPKGVMVSHRSLVNHALSVIEAYGLDEHHRVLQFIALNFDAAAEEIFPALACGAAVVLHPNPTGVTPSELLEYCARAGVNALHLPAAYWYQMEDELELSGRTLTEAVRLVVVGGDSPSREKMSRWGALAPGRPRFFNAYGPTEATITCTAHEASPGVQGHAGADGAVGDVSEFGAVGKLPIGRPLGNVQGYVLDGFLRPVPAWVAGELFLGGPGVARGYLNRPDLTAEKFVPHPFGATPGERLYRTGDTARFLPDGQIEFLGRVDRQVKLRGFRIELGEIEQALRRHPAVRDAYVDVVGEAEARRLAAYVVAAPDAATGATPDALARELRAHLQQGLPGYMVPAAFAVLDSLPLNANGKVERAMLPDAAPAGADPDEEFVAPRTPAEVIIAAACAQVLGLERLSVNSDFFALGGHSLAATRVVSQLRKSFGVEVPLRAIFESPSVAGLAETVEALLIMEIEGLSGAAAGPPPEPLAAAPG
jgi:amino acid adenylation domain-containing protein